MGPAGEVEFVVAEVVGLVVGEELLEAVAEVEMVEKEELPLVDEEGAVAVEEPAVDDSTLAVEL